MAPKDKGEASATKHLTNDNVKWPNFRMPKEQHLSRTNYLAWSVTWIGVLATAGFPLTGSIVMDDVVDFTMGWKLRETMKPAGLAMVATLPKGSQIWRLLKQLNSSDPACQIVLLDRFLDLKPKDDAPGHAVEYSALMAEMELTGIAPPPYFTHHL